MRYYFVLFLMVLFPDFSLGQGSVQKSRSIPMPPEASKFANYYTTPAISATGTMNIKIPLHEITIDEISIPIELNYHTGGIKVTDLSGSVGLGWSLNAGGGIYRTINNMADEKYSDDHHTFLSPLYNQDELVHGNSHTFSSQAKFQSISQGAADLNPDDYFYNFIDYTGGLYFDKNKKLRNDNIQPLEFEYSSNKLEYFSVYDDIGSTFLFSENEYTTAFGSTNKTSWKLSEILTNKNKKIDFEYLSYNTSHLISSHSSLYRIKNVSEPNDGIGLCFNDQDNFQNVYSQISNTNQLISKIESDDQIILFKYSDYPNASDWKKKLDYIELFNRDNELVKRIELKYKLAAGNQRLLLAEVIFHSLTSSSTHKYLLKYNENPVSPDTETLNKDLFGYFNYSTNTTLLSLPSSLFLNHSGTFGHLIGANRVPNLNGAIVNSLKKIVYPSGGNMTIEYSLNSESNKYAPGIRVNKIQTFDTDDSIVKTTNYFYSNLFGKLGTPHDVIINNNPVNIQYNLSAACFHYNSENRMQDQYLAANFYYKKIIIQEKFQDNIQSIAEYYSEPNIDTESDALNRYILKPMLVEKVYYDGNHDSNNIIKRERYQYETIYIDTNPVFKYELLSPYYSNELIDGSMVQCVNFYPGIVKERIQRPKWFRLQQHETEYMSQNSSSSIINRKKKFYNTHYDKYVAKQELIDSKGDTTNESFKFVWDFIHEDIDPLGKYYDMFSKRYIRYPVLSTRRKNNTVQTAEKEFDRDPVYGWYNVSKIKHLINGVMSSEELFTNYDQYGNNVSYKYNSLPQQITVWGYNGKYPVLLINNSTYAEIISIVNHTSIGNLNSTLMSSSIDAEITNLGTRLRASLPQAQVTSLTYKPLIGLSSKTNPNGVKKYYTYDSFGRLSAIVDNDGNLIKTYCYNHMGQQVDCNSFSINYYSNKPISQNFYKEGCPIGYIGSKVPYNIAAGKHQSVLSQEDADQKAINDLQTNGQSYANTHGQCIEEGTYVSICEVSSRTVTSGNYKYNYGTYLIQVWKDPDGRLQKQTPVNITWSNGTNIFTTTITGSYDVGEILIFEEYIGPPPGGGYEYPVSPMVMPEILHQPNSYEVINTDCGLPPLVPGEPGGPNPIIGSQMISGQVNSMWFFHSKADLCAYSFASPALPFNDVFYLNDPQAEQKCFISASSPIPPADGYYTIARPLLESGATNHYYYKIIAGCITEEGFCD